MKNTYVYFIQEKLGEKAPVKIGVAKDPENRLSVLQIDISRLRLKWSGEIVIMPHLVIYLMAWAYVF